MRISFWLRHYNLTSPPYARTHTRTLFFANLIKSSIFIAERNPAFTISPGCELGSVRSLSPQGSFSGLRAVFAVRRTPPHAGTRTVPMGHGRGTASPRSHPRAPAAEPAPQCVAFLHGAVSASHQVRTCCTITAAGLSSARSGRRGKRHKDGAPGAGCPEQRVTPSWIGSRHILPVTGPDRKYTELTAEIDPFNNSVTFSGNAPPLSVEQRWPVHFQGRRQPAQFNRVL